jgi:uncharacterized membrane protein HdeD (DUF308 family)
MNRMTGIVLAVLGVIAIIIGFVVFHGVGWPHPKSGDLAVLLGVVLIIVGLFGMARKAA